MQMLNKKKDHEVSVKVDITEKVEDCNKVKEETITKSATENAKVEHIKVHEDSDKEEERERLQRETNNKNPEQKEKFGGNVEKLDQVLESGTSKPKGEDEKEKGKPKDLIESKKEKQKDKIINKEEENKKNLIQNIGKIGQKSDANLPDIWIINQNDDSKNNLLEGSFLDD